MGDLVVKSDVLNAITKFYDDFNIESYNRRSIWLNKVNLSRKRMESYENINNQLLALGVHEPDNQVILDAHDYNLSLDEAVDFITFDDFCYKGATSIDEFSFNDVKTVSDFHTAF